MSDWSRTAASSISFFWSAVSGMRIETFISSRLSLRGLAMLLLLPKKACVVKLLALLRYVFIAIITLY